MPKIHRCLSPALLAVAVLLLGTTTALAQPHVTGFDMNKTCPMVVASGASYNCTVTFANSDDQHGIINLTLTNEFPFPGGTITPVDCRQPFDPADCTSGDVVTTLGIASTPEASCGACLPETAPFNCESTNVAFQDEVVVTGTDAAPVGSPFFNLPVFSSATNATPVAPHVCDDNNACTTDTCDPADPDGCVNAPISCDDNNTCTDDTCDLLTGCVFTDNGTCEVTKICRTPGFWGTHADDEKEGHSEDITGAILDRFNDANTPDLTICGNEISSSDEAIQAICASPKDNLELQLARQLMAAALNCIVTNSSGDEACVALSDTLGVPCGGVSVEAVWNACNAECDNDGDVTVDVDLDGDPLTDPVAVSCIAALDCFNTGFVLDTATGDCTDELTGCHERALDATCDEFDFLPAAGSSKECAAARKDCDSIFGPIPGCTP